MIRIGLLVLLVWSIRVAAYAQADISGETAVQFYKSASLQTPRALNGGKPGFGFFTALSAGVPVTEGIAALGTVSITENGYLNVEYLAIRFVDLTPLHLDFQAGRFDIPFGNLGDRRHPRRNPLYGLPLIHEYGTALPDVITTEAQVLANRGLGRGMKLLDRGIYDLGAMVSGSAGILDYAVAVTSGTVSSTTYGTGNTNNGLSTTVRLALVPWTGLTIGAAYMWGAYLETPVLTPPRNVDVSSYVQKAAEGDVEFSVGHLVLNGELVYSRYPVPLESRDEQFPVTGIACEGRFTVFPRCFVALRYGGLRFGNVLLGSVLQPWDYNVDELEGGLGYFVARDALVKVVHRETRTMGGSRPKDSLTAFQITVAY